MKRRKFCWYLLEWFTLQLPPTLPKPSWVDCDKRFFLDIQRRLCLNRLVPTEVKLTVTPRMIKLTNYVSQGSCWSCKVNFKEYSRSFQGAKLHFQGLSGAFSFKEKRDKKLNRISNDQRRPATISQGSSWILPSIFKCVWVPNLSSTVFLSKLYNRVALLRYLAIQGVWKKLENFKMASKL